MKTICIGDIHGYSSWKLIVHNSEKDADQYVFVGDYFDSFDISGIEQMRNFEDIIAFKKESSKPVILLIGNHDHHYFPEIGYSGTSGYQAGIAKNIEFLINENRSYLQMAYSFDNILCTHAGVGEAWMERIVKNGIADKLPEFTAEGVANFVEEMWENKPALFKFTGRDGSGDDMGQTPIWIRPRSLMRDSQEMKNAGIIQIVGHTPQNQIDIEGKATGNKYFFIDTLGRSGEYLIHENGVFSTGSIR